MNMYDGYFNGLKTQSDILAISHPQIQRLVASKLLSALLDFASD